MFGGRFIMPVKELLPIGSVVLMQGGSKRIMITGVKQTDAADKKKTEYDYIGVMYPEGYIGVQYQFLFNHGDVTEVFFRGFEDKERDDFIGKLESVYANG
jgi:hypothetical protein